eukprot:10646326-Lingulodinium_polyedra.AAC.1
MLWRASWRDVRPSARLVTTHRSVAIKAVDGHAMDMVMKTTSSTTKDHWPIQSLLPRQALSHAMKCGTGANREVVVYC